MHRWVKSIWWNIFSFFFFFFTVVCNERSSWLSSHGIKAISTFQVSEHFELSDMGFLPNNWDVIWLLWNQDMISQWLNTIRLHSLTWVVQGVIHPGTQQCVSFSCWSPEVTSLSQGCPLLGTFNNTNIYWIRCIDVSYWTPMHPCSSAGWLDSRK